MLRDFLDEILDFIGSETLSDVEFDALEDIEPAVAQDYSKATYEALKGILEEREGVSGQGRRLMAFFQAKGLDLDAGLVPTPNSNILIGKPLC